MRWGLVPFESNDFNRERDYMKTYTHPVTGELIKNYPINSTKRGSNTEKAMQPYVDYAKNRFQEVVDEGKRWIEFGEPKKSLIVNGKRKSRE